MSDIRAGDAVVCVDAEPYSWTLPSQAAELREYLSEGRFYRVRQVGSRWDGWTIFLLGIPDGELLSSLTLLERMNAAFDRMAAAALARDAKAYARARDEFHSASPRKSR